MSEPHDRYHVNLFKPVQGGMRDEVAIILAVLLGWGVVTFGSQLLLALFKDAVVWSPTRGIILFHLPLHVFFTGQFLPLWFVILCLVFNLYIDRVALKHSRKKDRSYD